MAAETYTLKCHTLAASTAASSNFNLNVIGEFQTCFVLKFEYSLKKGDAIKHHNFCFSLLQGVADNN